MPDHQTSGATRNRGRVATLWVALAFAVLAGFPGTGPPGAFGQCQYEVTAIIEAPECDILGPSPTFGQGMNNHGEVVGYYWPCAIGNDEAFYWSQDTGFITLPKPQGVVRAWAYDINDTGIIVGQHEFTGIGRMGFVYDMNANGGEFIYLEPLHDGLVALNLSSANAINNAGVVAGMRVIGKPGQSPMPSNAVIWDTNTGEVVDLGVMNGPNSWASDIPNTSTDTVGSTGTTLQASGYRQVEGNVELLSKFFQLSISFCHGTGDFGFVTGSGIPIGSSDSSAFLWVGDNLLLLDPLPGFSNCGASDVNAFGHVVTRCSPGDVPGLWQNGEIFNLHDLIISGSDTINWPRAINNHGQILLRLGNTRAVLITPVGVPFADLNFDCKVNEHDLLILLAAFGPQPSASGSRGQTSHPADLNGDGIVNVTDLLIMLGNWNR